MDEGGELEDALEPGEEAWAGPEDEARAAPDDEDVRRMDLVGPRRSVELPALDIRDGDAVEEIAAATQGWRRFRALKRLRDKMVAPGMNLPRCVFIVNKEQKELEWGLRSRIAVETGVNMRRAVEANQWLENEKIERARSKARARARKLPNERREKKRLAKAKAAALKAHAHKMSLFAKLPKTKRERLWWRRGGHQEPAWLLGVHQGAFARPAAQVRGGAEEGRRRVCEALRGLVSIEHRATVRAPD